MNCSNNIQHDFFQELKHRPDQISLKKKFYLKIYSFILVDPVDTYMITESIQLIARNHTAKTSYQSN